MKKIRILLVSAVIITTLLLSGVVIAAPSAKVEFISTEKADDIIELEVKIKDATFMGIQAEINYSVQTLAPATDSGEIAMRFSEFASKQTDFFNTIGLYLDKEAGKIGFTLYIMPGTDAEGVNDRGEFTADENGVSLYKFRFKKIAEGDWSFEIPTGTDENREISVMDYDNGDLELNLSFVYPEKETESVVVAPPVKVEKPELTSDDRKKDVICLKIGNKNSFVYGEMKQIDKDNELVVPYITNDRTLVPLRFVAETLGAEVLWEEGWNGCKIKKDGKEIEITFGSAKFKVNGEEIVYDAPIELAYDRTMVPIRFISEQFDMDVYWNEKNSAVVISPKSNPWQEKRDVEITALNEMLITILEILPN